MSRYFSATALLSPLVLAACGQAGNLYLPSEGVPASEQGHKTKTSESPAAPAASTPAEQQKKKEQDASPSPAAPAEPSTAP